MKNKIIFASAFLSLALVVGSIGSVFANEVAPADNQPVATNEEAQPAVNNEAQPSGEAEKPAENKVDAQPASASEEAQPSENAEKPAENNNCATTANKENAEYKYEIVFSFLIWDGIKGSPMGLTGIEESVLLTNDPKDLSYKNISNLSNRLNSANLHYYSSDRHIGTLYDDKKGTILIKHLFVPQDMDKATIEKLMPIYKAGLYDGSIKFGKPVIIDENGNITNDKGDMTNSSSDSKDSSNKAKKSKSPNTSGPASVGLGVMAMVSALGGLVTFRKNK